MRTPRARAIQLSIVAFVAAATVSCGSSGASPSPLNLSGTWTGVVGSGSGNASALRVTWVATQIGSAVSGAATVATSPAVTNIAFNGSMTGTLAGSQVSLAFAAPPGSVPAFPNCAASANGSAAVVGKAMSGNLMFTFTSCQELGLQPPALSELTLTRQ